MDSAKLILSPYYLYDCLLSGFYLLCLHTWPPFPPFHPFILSNISLSFHLCVSVCSYWTHKYGIFPFYVLDLNKVTYSSEFALNIFHSSSHWGQIVAYMKGNTSLLHTQSPADCCRLSIWGRLLTVEYLSQFSFSPHMCIWFWWLPLTHSPVKSRWTQIMPRPHWKFLDL